MIYDFHTHTFLSDGELSPLELIQRAVRNGYRAIAITDHAGPGELERFISEVTRDCALAERYWNITAIPGVELTHLPPSAICDVAKEARELGAQIVVVHGETIVEPVETGTNAAAAKCPHVDILAHPGLIAPGDARSALTSGVFVEISARKGHSLTNGLVAKVCREAGAKMLLGSDAHDEGDLLSPDLIAAILRGTGLYPEEVEEVMEANPVALMDRTHKI